MNSARFIMAGAVVAALCGSAPQPARAGLALPEGEAMIEGTAISEAESPHDLFFTFSWYSTADQRWAVRSFLAAQHPDTAVGIAAKGWVLSNTGQFDAAYAAFKACSTLTETALYCSYRLLLDPYRGRLSDDDVGAMLKLAGEKGNQADGLLLLYNGLVRHFIQYKHDPATAKALIGQWEASNQHAAYVPHLNGTYAELADKDYAAAADHYRRAAAADPTNWDAVADYLSVALNKLSSPSDPKENLARHFEVAKDFIETLAARGDRRMASVALVAIADRMIGLGEAVAAYDMYATAFGAFPSGDAAVGVDRAYWKMSAGHRSVKDDGGIGGIIGFLENADKKIPGNPKILTALGENYAKYDRKKSEQYYRAAIAMPSPSDDVQKRIRNFGRDVYEAWGEHDRAMDLYAGVAAPRAGHLLETMYGNRLAVGDLKRAAEVLAEYEAAVRQDGTIVEAWFDLQKHRLRDYAEAEAARNVFREQHPFLKEWEQAFGERLTLSLNFATGSDALTPADKARLDEVAGILERPDADQYLFGIEGHTDSVGDAEANRRLSEKRANAVAAYLVSRHGIAGNRLVASGVGQDAPVASNRTDEGRQQNRRVDIVPLGKKTAPILAAPAVMDTSFAAASPDGRLLALGSEPMQLWDRLGSVKLRDLGRGGKRSFSPTGRYVATGSNYKEAGGFDSYEVIIYDVRSGLTVARLPQQDEINALAWDSSGRRLAFITEDGRLAIYDMATRQLRSRPLPSRSQPSKLVWLKGEPTIVVGYVWGAALQAFDSNTLELTDELSGVAYPHDLTQTADGRFLISIDNDHVLSVWNTADWSAKPRQMTLPIIGRMGAHPFTHTIAVSHLFGDQTEFAVVDVEAMKVVGQAKGAAGDERLWFSADDKALYRPAKGGIEIRDRKTLAHQGDIRSPAAKTASATIDATGAWLVTSDDEGLSVWEAATGKQVWRRPGLSLVGRLGDAAEIIVREGAADSPAQTYGVLDPATRQVRRLIQGGVDFKVTEEARRGDYLVLAGVAIRPEHSADLGIIAVYDMKGGKQLSRSQVRITTERGAFATITEPSIDSVDITADGREAVFATSWTDGYKTGTVRAKAVRIVDLASGEERKRLDFAKPVVSVAFATGGVATVIDGVKVIRDRGTGEELRRDTRFGLGRKAFDLADGSALAYVDDRLVRTLNGATTASWASGGPIRRVTVHEGTGRVLVLSWSGHVVLLDLQSLAPIMSLIQQHGGEWLASRSDGGFVGSDKASAGVRWFVGGMPVEKTRP